MVTYDYDDYLFIYRSNWLEGKGEHSARDGENSSPDFFMIHQYVFTMQKIVLCKEGHMKKIVTIVLVIVLVLLTGSFFAYAQQTTYCFKFLTAYLR